MPSSDALAARAVAFAAPAVLSVTEDLVRAVLPALGEDADPDLVAEETLVLVATATARAAEVGFREHPEAVAVVGAALTEVPLFYFDYLLGTQLVAEGAEGEVEVDQTVYVRLERKAQFYGAHLPPGRFPGPRAVADVMPLWMGRISPPKLPTTPQQRLGELGLADRLAVHTRLVLAFAQRLVS
ncbi:MAG TPA: hypothetical protein VD962_02415 [Rubricoccaceae bacterium]|nr:hypothetical protein [Rubricoccaceae bacterium]